MSNLDLIAKRGEKNLLVDMFRDSDDESVISVYSNEDNDISSSTVLSNDVGASNLVIYTSIVSKIVIQVHQNKVLGISTQLWPAASFLSDYLDSNSTLLNNQKLIIELGSGIGLVGIFLSKLLEDQNTCIVMTDLHNALDLMNQNIILNNASNIYAMELCWGLPGDFDRVKSFIDTNYHDTKPLIIAADCIYWECLYDPFLTTILNFISIGCEILIAHVRRWKKDGKFFALCRKRGLIISILHEVIDSVVNENTNQVSRRVTRIYKISI